MKSIENYNELTLDEINEKLEERIAELENLRVQQATHQITNPMRIRYVRRDIARIKTILHKNKTKTN